MENVTSIRLSSALFNLGEKVKTLNGEVIEINRVERINGAVEIRYNGAFWESELFPVRNQEALEKKAPLFAFENLKNGNIVLKTRPFSGNQYIRPISLSGYQLV